MTGLVALGNPLTRLSPRESEVLAAMTEGRTNAGIAEGLFLSQKAVEKHIKSIFSKLGLTGYGKRHPRVQAVLMALAETQPHVKWSQATPDTPSVRPGSLLPRPETGYRDRR